MPEGPHCPPSGRPCVLVADDEASMRELLELVLRGEGYEVLGAASGPAALELFREHRDSIELVIQDLKMPGTDGTTLLKRFKDEAPQIPVVVITAFSTWDSAVEAMRLGAYDYLRKPFDMETMRLVVNRAVERTRALRAQPGSHPDPGVLYDMHDKMVGNHAKVQEVLRMVRRIAPTDSTVLIQGESGTGKELVARAVHYRSGRRDQPFISVNCSAFAESLLESELFGHVRGAFTGAVEDKEGFFRAANGGTLFLDEVAEMSLTTQVKILRVLEERKVCPVGCTRSHSVDVRIIAATNKDMEGEVRAGRFREDLFYRLNVIPLWLPPLRERKEDIPLLAGAFLARYSRQMHKNVTGISEEGREALYSHSWPGNVRELENVIQRHVALCEGPVIERIELSRAGASRREDLTPASSAAQLIPEHGLNLLERLEDFEKAHLREALRLTRGNLTHAARLLGMSYRSIRYRVKKLRVREEARV